MMNLHVNDLRTQERHKIQDLVANDKKNACVKPFKNMITDNIINVMLTLGFTS